MDLFSEGLKNLIENPVTYFKLKTEEVTYEKESRNVRDGGDVECSSVKREKSNSCSSE